MEIIKTCIFAVCLLYTGFISVVWSAKNTGNTLVKLISTAVFLLGIPGLIGVIQTANFNYMYNINIIYPAAIAAFFLFTRGMKTIDLLFKGISLIILGLAITYFSLHWQ
jgi:hypothetical protein